jgi:hypothetical protein
MNQRWILSLLILILIDNIFCLEEKVKNTMLKNNYISRIKLFLNFLNS